MAEKLHTVIEGTDGPSIPLEYVHPSDISKRHQNSKEASGKQSSNQRTFIRFHSYSDEQPNVKSDKAEKIHKAPRRSSLEEDSHDETGLNKETYQDRVHEWCSSTVHNTDHQNTSKQDVTTSQPGRKESDRKTIPEKDIYDDEGVTVTLEEGDNKHETMKSVKSNSNQWEDSYYEHGESMEYHQIKMKQIGNSKILSNQPGTRQPDDKVPNLKEGIQVDDSTTFEQINDEATKATSDNTIRLEETRIHIRKKVGTTHINEKLVAPMFDSCSAATMVNRSIITDSDEVEIIITNIEGQDFKMSWRNTVHTDTNDENYMVIHPPGKHLHFPFNETAHCNNQNTKQIKEESVMSPYRIGYGYRRTAGWLMNKNELNLPVNNELYVEEEIDVTKSNENKTVDDPRRGAKTLESEWISPDNISICSENASIESRGSEVTRE